MIDQFKIRSENPSRLENFSDAVFAFSITLLMISLEVLKKYFIIESVCLGNYLFLFLIS